MLVVWLKFEKKNLKKNQIGTAKYYKYQVKI